MNSRRPSAPHSPLVVREKTSAMSAILSAMPLYGDLLVEFISRMINTRFLTKSPYNVITLTIVLLLSGYDRLRRSYLSNICFDII